jgi:8-oxo-dGTP pyrophosphatase MutT (NUDIX family)
LDALRREVAEELGVQLEGVDGQPVLHRVDPQRGLDLTVWVSGRWRGDVSNMQPHEHDAIGWFGAARVEGLKLADPSYLTVLRHLLSA